NANVNRIGAAAVESRPRQSGESGPILYIRETECRGNHAVRFSVFFGFFGPDPSRGCTTNPRVMGGPGLFFKSDAPFLEKNVQDLKISTAAMRCKIRQIGSQPRKMPKRRPYAKFLAIDLFSG